MSVSIRRAASALGGEPCSMCRKFAAWPSRGSGATGARPLRMCWCAATIIGTCELRRMPLRTIASGELSATSGSKAASADTAVRSTSIGWAALTMRINSRISAGSVRAAFDCAVKPSSCPRDGSSPRSSR
jgi:hypothetical protein